jgi:hypothetical protein
MPFDKSLDKELFKEEFDFEMTKIAVSVFSYNDGTPKLQLGRQNRNPNSGDWMFSKLGRLTKEEAEKVYAAMGKALETMK